METVQAYVPERVMPYVESAKTTLTPYVEKGLSYVPESAKTGAATAYGKTSTTCTQLYDKSMEVGAPYFDKMKPYTEKYPLLSKVGAVAAGIFGLIFLGFGIFALTTSLCVLAFLGFWFCVIEGGILFIGALVALPIVACTLGFVFFLACVAGFFGLMYHLYKRIPYYYMAAKAAWNARQAKRAADRKAREAKDKMHVGVYRTVDNDPTKLGDDKDDAEDFHVPVSEASTPSGENFNIDYKEPSRRKMSKDKIVSKVKNAFGGSHEKVAGKTA